MNFIDFIVENGVIIVAALWILGEIIKKTSVLDNRFIPLTLLVISFFLSPLVLGGFTPENIVQAILVTGGAVFADQFAKQLLPDKEDK